SCRVPAVAQLLPVVQGIPQPDCQPRPRGISPWIGCHQWAQSQQWPSFSPDAEDPARLSFLSTSAPPLSNEVGPAPRCPRQCEHLRSRCREGSPARQCTLWKWPEPRGPPLFAHDEDIPKMFVRERWLEPAHRAPSPSSYSPCGSRGKVYDVRLEPTRRAIQPRRPAMPAANPRRAMR